MLVSVVILSLLATTLGKHKVWLDMDPGLEDAFAIVLAATNGDIDVLGISTTFGSSSNIRTSNNALDILHALNRLDVPVFRGASGSIKNPQISAKGIVLGERGFFSMQLNKSPNQAITENVWKQMSEAIITSDEKISVVITGAITNWCLLLKNYTPVKDKIKQFIFVGGALGEGNASPSSEYNVHYDPEAAECFLDIKKNIPLYIIPIELSNHIRMTQQLDELLGKHQKTNKMIQMFSTLTLTAKLFMNQSMPIADLVGVDYVLHPQNYQVECIEIVVDTYETSYGRTNIYYWGIQELQTCPNKLVSHIKCLQCIQDNLLLSFTKILQPQQGL